MNNQGLFRYGFDAFAARGGRYRDLQTGRFVTTREVEALIDNTIARMADDLEALAAGAADPRNPMSAREFRDAAALILRNGHGQMAMLGAGGRARMTPSAWGRVGRLLRDEYAYLANFATELDAGTISVAQATARARLYANKMRTAYYDIKTQRLAASGGYTQERRILGNAEHCDDCIGYAAQGWVRIGTLPEPGERSRCMNNCKCSKEYR